jgi:phenylalanyl-tRNA synthetase alpha chain
MADTPEEPRRDQWLAAIRTATTEDELQRVERELLGRDGAVTGLVKSVASLPADERPAKGKAYNLLKKELEAAITTRRSELDAEALARALEAGDFDPSEPGLRRAGGSLHPIGIVQDELVDLFTSMGFTWLDGPEVETDFYNFEALNIPADHPARDSQDTFFLDDGNVLRTHTSPVQIRGMRRFGPPPLRLIAPGRCFRAESVDASHEHTFYQMEGIVVDEGISVAHLIHTMKTCLTHVLQRDLEVRLRPGFFPFVEPGFELDVNCPFCGGKGCSVCKHSGWIEILPCGMVHPHVLEAGGIDPERYTGFAFGMGLQRVVMMRYGIDDIRLFMGGDLRFLRQFGRIPS